MDGGCAEEEEEEGAEGCFHGDRGSPAPSQEVAHRFLSDATEGVVSVEGERAAPPGPTDGLQCYALPGLRLSPPLRSSPRGGHCANRRYRH